MEMTFGENLKQLRMFCGLSQRELADATNIKQSNISAWENNINAPSIEFCIRLADFYRITLDELVGREI